MSREPIKRTAQDVTVTLWMDGWPRSCNIEVGDYPPGSLRLFGTEQIRALHYLLGEVLAADPMPDDRPKTPATPG